MTKHDSFQSICRIRIAVSFLGEKGQHAWWKTSFLSPTGFRFIERLFPKTSRTAAAESAGEAAKRVHDEVIGKGQVCHLFRFSPESEENLHAAFLSISPEDIEQICTSAESAKAVLIETASGSSAASVGPKQIGPIRDALIPDSLSAIAAHYLSGFENNTPTFPYFA